MPSQEFHGPVDQVVVGTAHNHHHWPATAPPPPDDPGKSIECPQCGYRTWRRTALCIHCQFDIAGHLRRERRARGNVRVRRFAAVLCVAAAAAWVTSHWLQGMPAVVAQAAAALLSLLALRAFGSSFE